MLKILTVKNNTLNSTLPESFHMDSLLLHSCFGLSENNIGTASSLSCLYRLLYPISLPCDPHLLYVSSKLKVLRSPTNSIPIL